MTDSSPGVIGRFFWRELMCPDPEAGTQFYGELFGWSVTASEMPGYHLIRHAGVELGGFLTMTDEMRDIPPSWVSYVAVEDVDAVARAVQEHGGAVAVPPQDIPSVGRFTVVSDPTGAALTAMSNDGPVPSPSEAPPVGHFCWETLTTTDAGAAERFYAGVFGWTSQPGPAPGMNVLAAGDAVVADVQVRTDQPSHWLPYVVVDDLPQAHRRAEGLGGDVVVPEIPVPEVGAIGIIADPFGAHLGLFRSATG